MDRRNPKKTVSKVSWSCDIMLLLPHVIRHWATSPGSGWLGVKALMWSNIYDDGKQVVKQRIYSLSTSAAQLSYEQRVAADLFIVFLKFVKCLMFITRIKC